MPLTIFFGRLLCFNASLCSRSVSAHTQNVVHRYSQWMHRRYCCQQQALIYLHGLLTEISKSRLIFIFIIVFTSFETLFAERRIILRTGPPGPLAGCRSRACARALLLPPSIFTHAHTHAYAHTILRVLTLSGCLLVEFLLRQLTFNDKNKVRVGCVFLQFSLIIVK